MIGRPAAKRLGHASAAILSQLMTSLHDRRPASGDSELLPNPGFSIDWLFAITALHCTAERTKGLTNGHTNRKLIDMVGWILSVLFKQNCNGLGNNTTLVQCVNALQCTEDTCCPKILEIRPGVPPTGFTKDLSALSAVQYSAVQYSAMHCRLFPYCRCAQFWQFI
jgi:hypothetical protein